MTIPAWLARRAQGDTRATTLRLCHRCHRPVLRGLDADILATTAICDPTPLTPLGEAIALITDRHTYTLSPGRDRRELDYRDEWRIQQPTKNPILPAHQCNGISLAPFTTPTAAPTANHESGKPPF